MPLDYIFYTELYSYFIITFPSESYFSYKSVIPQEGVLKYITVIYFSMSAGIVEELYFLGFFFKISGYFKNSISIYLISSPILFSLIHWEGSLANIFSTYFFGLFASIAFLYMKNLWPLILGHVFTDAMYFS